MIRGECFKNAYQKAREKDGVLVHGKVTNPIYGRVLDHAWVETADTVIDPTIDLEAPKEKYYSVAKAVPENRYSVEEAMILMVRTKNYGPWTEAERKQVKGKDKFKVALGEDIFQAAGPEELPQRKDYMDAMLRKKKEPIYAYAKKLVDAINKTGKFTAITEDMDADLEASFVWVGLYSGETIIAFIGVLQRDDYGPEDYLGRRDLWQIWMEDPDNRDIELMSRSYKLPADNPPPLEPIVKEITSYRPKMKEDIFKRASKKEIEKRQNSSPVWAYATKLTKAFNDAGYRAIRAGLGFWDNTGDDVTSSTIIIRKPNIKDGEYLNPLIHSHQQDLGYINIYTTDNIDREGGPVRWVIKTEGRPTNFKLYSKAIDEPPTDEIVQKFIENEQSGLEEDIFRAATKSALKKRGKTTTLKIIIPTDFFDKYNNIDSEFYMGADDLTETYSMIRKMIEDWIKHFHPGHNVRLLDVGKFHLSRVDTSFFEWKGEIEVAGTERIINHLNWNMEDNEKDGERGIYLNYEKLNEDIFSPASKEELGPRMDKLYAFQVLAGNSDLDERDVEEWPDSYAEAMNLARKLVASKKYRDVWIEAFNKEDEDEDSFNVWHSGNRYDESKSIFKAASPEDVIGRVEFQNKLRKEKEEKIKQLFSTAQKGDKVRIYLESNYWEGIVEEVKENGVDLRFELLNPGQWGRPTFQSYEYIGSTIDDLDNIEIIPKDKEWDDSKITRRGFPGLVEDIFKPATPKDLKDREKDSPFKRVYHAFDSASERIEEFFDNLEDAIKFAKQAEEDGADMRVYSMLDDGEDFSDEDLVYSSPNDLYTEDMFKPASEDDLKKRNEEKKELIRADLEKELKASEEVLQALAGITTLTSHYKYQKNLMISAIRGWIEAVKQQFNAPLYDEDKVGKYWTELHRTRTEGEMFVSGLRSRKSMADAIYRYCKEDASADELVEISNWLNAGQFGGAGIAPREEIVAAIKKQLPQRTAFALADVIRHFGKDKFTKTTK